LKYVGQTGRPFAVRHTKKFLNYKQNNATEILITKKCTFLLHIYNVKIYS